MELRALVVDPDPSIRTLLIAVARRNGLDADAAGDHDEAVRLAVDHHYTVVILDPLVPGGDALFSELRRPIIVTTTSRCGEFEERPGVVAVLRKPFDLASISAAIGTCCPPAA